MSEDILKKVLKKIKPDAKEIRTQKNKAAQIIKHIKKLPGSHVDAIFAGSAARGTDLTGDKDIDIFVLYPLKISNKQLEKEGLEIGKQIAGNKKLELKYASHPYTYLPNYEGFVVEIVPAFKIKTIKEFKSAVDRTPLHQKYVQKNLKPKQKDQVRLLKKFMKALEIYGAEMGTWGFSGYLCELLVIKYGSFTKVLENASEWSFPTLIDLKTKHKNPELITKRFPKDALIVIDPTDPKRNVASAVSNNTFAKLVHYSRKFLEHPSEKFFKKHTIRPKPLAQIKKKIKEKKTKIIGVKLPYPTTNDDIAISQIEKAKELVKKAITKHEFQMHRTDIITDRKTYAILLLEFEVWNLPKYQVHPGPPITAKKNQEAFIKKHRKLGHSVWIEEDRWVAERKRKYNDALKYVKLKVQDGKKGKLPLPSHVKTAMKKAKLMNEKQIIEEYKKNKDFQSGFTNYLFKKERFLEFE